MGDTPTNGTIQPRHTARYAAMTGGKLHFPAELWSLIERAVGALERIAEELERLNDNLEN